MKIFRLSLMATAAAATFALPTIASARLWLLPSETMFAGNGDEWVTVDFANSTDLFYFDHPAPQMEPVIFAPDGTQVQAENKGKGRFRATFDIHLTQKGTYKVAAISNAVFGSYTLNGEEKRLPRGTTAETLAQAIPAGATDVKTTVMAGRVETFLTAGEPTNTVFKATGEGLEMVPVTHPNDLIAGEKATFQFLLNGKPAANLPVVAIPGGVRYRGDLKQMDARTDAEGKVTFTWSDAGMYWISVTTAPPRPAPAAEGAPRPEPPPRPPRIDSYAATFEVLGS
ncbi:MAG: DUF4198 domain-containing protein [Sphingobium phenoxybenzoativorans]